MGIFRKMVSVSTLGMVRYRTPVENISRTARYTKRTARFTKQTRNAVLFDSMRGSWQHQEMMQSQHDQLAMQRAALVMDAQRLDFDRQQVALQRQSVTIQGGSPAGWYRDPVDSRAMCWWDGARWHPESKHYPPVRPLPALPPRS